jgi:hypothetical protein
MYQYFIKVGIIRKYFPHSIFFLHAIIITQLLSTDVKIVYDVMKYVLDDLDSDFSLNINYCIIFRENKKNINFIMLLLFSPTCRYTSESVLIVSYCDVLSLLFG